MMNNVDEILSISTANDEVKNTFPMEVFPKILRDLIQELESVCNYPKDYTAGALILATATAIGNTTKIRLKHGFTDNLCFYLNAVGNASANKSRPFSTILKPINEKDFEAYQEYKKALKECQDNDNKPKQINYILQDFTPETIARSLEANNRGVLIFNDEVLQWLKSFNRYNNSGSLEMYLSLWNGKNIKVNRANGESISVKNALLNIGGTIQPSRLNEAFNDNGNGFIDRFLFLYPTETNSNEWNLSNLSKETFTEYNALIKRLFDYAEFDQHGDPKFIECDHEAKNLIINFVNQNKAQFKDLDEWEISLMEKLHSYFLRFCLLLFCLDKYTFETNDPLISFNQVERAIKLVEYFRNTAYKVRETIRNGTDYISTLNQSKQNLYNALKENFTTAEAVNLGVNFEIPERSLKRFLNDKKAFKKMKQGEYKKLL